MEHVPSTTIRRADNPRPFAALADHIAAADAERGRRLRMTAAARAANRERKTTR